MSREVDSRGTQIQGERPVAIPELGKNIAIETITADVIKADEFAMEVFMNEIVTVLVHETAVEGELDVISPSVNGVNQPIRRGVETPVRRKYVEALARAKETKYKQADNHMDPSDRPMIPKTAPSYPFSLIEDKNPRGRDWLKNILAQPA